MATKGGKGIYIAALVLFLGGVGYLVGSGVTENSVYFLNVGEALATESSKLKQARLFGNVAAEGIEPVQPGPGVSFVLLDKDNPGQTLRVTYRGAVPDAFKAGAEVIVEGGLDSAGKTFTASTLITKCPSKYEKQNRG
ncbi:cytochrome c-type biogenesis protein CcmE [Humidesulfovibrio mexicanus]|uniref:Cytochrome c-type biogenesis protein CcmE n=1 Tax=Humidesulfovibrio mexicanus TaxID=147047 RepID=A0A239B0A4_9BACT|nr:cytochrome c maturation protein CcmE [Humidesulfovibrio mexicanus]SNS01230.1 cytochrome c-type biogenesis protein CcmE [Humidesulfovibrio mexicanus]